MCAQTRLIEDYATGSEIPAKPEEQYRQEFEHTLIDDLGYPRERIEIEYPIQRGSTRKAEAADIIVFSGAVGMDEQI